MGEAKWREAQARNAVVAGGHVDKGLLAEFFPFWTYLVPRAEISGRVFDRIVVIYRPAVLEREAFAAWVSSVLKTHIVEGAEVEWLV